MSAVYFVEYCDPGSSRQWMPACAARNTRSDAEQVLREFAARYPLLARHARIKRYRKVSA